MIGSILRWVFGSAKAAVPVKPRIIPMEDTEFSHLRKKKEEVSCPTVPVIKKAAEAAKKPRKPSKRVDKTPAIIPTQTKHSSPTTRKTEDNDPLDVITAAGIAAILSNDSNESYSGGGGSFGGGGASGSWDGEYVKVDLTMDRVVVPVERYGNELTVIKTEFDKTALENIAHEFRDILNDFFGGRRMLFNPNSHLSTEALAWWNANRPNRRN